MTLFVGIALSEETFNEKLKFWTLKNDFNLLSFEFDFKIPLQDNEKNLLLENTAK